MEARPFSPSLSLQSQSAHAWNGLDTLRRDDFAEELVVCEDDAVLHFVAALLHQIKTFLSSQIWAPEPIKHGNDKGGTVSMAAVGNGLQRAEVVEIKEVRSWRRFIVL